MRALAGGFIVGIWLAGCGMAPPPVAHPQAPGAVEARWGKVTFAPFLERSASVPALPVLAISAEPTIGWGTDASWVELRLDGRSVGNRRIHLGKDGGLYACREVANTAYWLAPASTSFYKVGSYKAPAAWVDRTPVAATWAGGGKLGFEGGRYVILSMATVPTVTSPALVAHEDVAPLP